MLMCHFIKLVKKFINNTKIPHFFGRSLRTVVGREDGHTIGLQGPCQGGWPTGATMSAISGPGGGHVPSETTNHGFFAHKLTTSLYAPNAGGTRSISSICCQTHHSFWLNQKIENSCGNWTQPTSLNLNTRSSVHAKNLIFKHPLEKNSLQTHRYTYTDTYTHSTPGQAQTQMLKHVDTHRSSKHTPF